MTATFPDPRMVPSPLARDVVLSRVCLATLRVVDGASLEDEDVRDVAELRRILETDFVADATPASIPAHVVPQDSMRHLLDRTLATLAPRRRAVGWNRPENLQLAIDLLARLEAARALPSADASALLQLLLSLDAREAPSAAPLDLVSGRGASGVTA